MIEIEIPGLKTYRFEHLVLDVNGTIAKDGQLIEGVAGLLKELRSTLRLHLVTADTHGLQAEIDRQLGITASRIAARNQIEAKLRYIQDLGVETVVAVGNGANDAAMLEHAALGIAIVGPEGCATETLRKSDIVVPHIHAALEILLHPKRLIATLRR
ncbi:MAG: HAD family hydrolase [Acidobacteriota bacterium]|jgi:P-type E1-E2 ATPase|nr:HAD family hydrolase [Acidobacteriota bacterium]